MCIYINTFEYMYIHIYIYIYVYIYMYLCKDIYRYILMIKMDSYLSMRVESSRRDPVPCLR